MTLDDIKESVEKIRKCKSDDESAHSMEDMLREDFIVYVASLGDEDLALKALEVLKTNEIEFARWCA